MASSYPSWHGLIVKNIQVEKTTKNANQQNTKACVNCRIFPLVLSIVEAVNFRKKTEPTLIPASVQDWECAGKQQLQLQDSVHAVPLHITLRYLQGEYFRYFKSTTKQHALPLFFSKNKLQYIVWQFSRNYFIRFVLEQLAKPEGWTLASTSFGILWTFSLLRGGSQNWRCLRGNLCHAHVTPMKLPPSSKVPVVKSKVVASIPHPNSPPHPLALLAHEPTVPPCHQPTSQRERYIAYPHGWEVQNTSLAPGECLKWGTQLTAA